MEDSTNTAIMNMWSCVPFEWVADFLDHMDTLNCAKSIGVALLEKGADVLAKDKGNTPLHSACYYGLAEVVMVLLEMEADVDAKTNVGSTPLYGAYYYYGKTEVAMTLLNNCADVQAKRWRHALVLGSYHGPTRLVAMLLGKSGGEVG